MFGKCNYDIITCGVNADCIEIDELVLTSQTDELTVTSHFCSCKNGFRGNGTHCEGGFSIKKTQNTYVVY